ncbi:MAG: hypothetical protein ABIF12_03365 [bacterium]
MGFDKSILKAFTDPNLNWVPQVLRGKYQRFKVEGIRDGVLIRVIVEFSRNGIITGFPLKGCGIYCNTKI